MVIPVATKPFLHSFNFFLHQQGVPAFFFIHKKISDNIFTSCQRGTMDMSQASSFGVHILLLCGIIKFTNFNDVIEIGVL
ncbi:MAG TPA: hypothetical protein VMU29_05660 [Smithella sp.]|nr:hypothetical protein [Smithella sp.]